MTVKKIRESWSQKRDVSAVPWDIAGMQGLSSVHSSVGVKVRVPHSSKPFSSPRTYLRGLSWKGCPQIYVPVMRIQGNTPGFLQDLWEAVNPT